MSDWIPEFKGQRPPFQPGNQVSVGNRGPWKHGATSPRATEPIARALVKEMLTEPDLDYLHAPKFRGALWDWARAEARSRLVNEWAAGLSMEEATAEPDGRAAPLELARQLTVRAANMGDRIGLSPAAAKEMADEIRQARETLRRTAERKALHDDLVEAAREAWYPDD